ncbi:unnamed protein product, partial [Effrenium voratum]
MAAGQIDLEEDSEEEGFEDRPLMIKAREEAAGDPVQGGDGASQEEQDVVRRGVGG